MTHTGKTPATEGSRLLANPFVVRVPRAGVLLDVAKDSESFECDVEIWLDSPAGGWLLGERNDQGARLCGRDIRAGPAFALGSHPQPGEAFLHGAARAGYRRPVVGESADVRAHPGVLGGELVVEA